MVTQRLQPTVGRWGQCRARNSVDCGSVDSRRPSRSPNRLPTASSMGKTKTRQPASRDAAGSVQLENGGTGVELHALSDKLRSPTVSHRSAACISVANLAERCSPQLLQGGILALIMPLLRDADASIRRHAAGALRNLCVADDAGVANELLRLDAFDALVKLVIETAPDDACLPLLIATLADTLPPSSSAVQSGAIWSLASLIQTSPTVAHAILDLFRAVVESSPEASEALLTNNQAVLPVRSALSSASPLTSANAVALLALVARQVPSHSNEILAAVVPVLGRWLSVDLDSALAELASHHAVRRDAVQAELDKQREAYNGNPGSNMFQPTFDVDAALEEAWEVPFQAFRDQALAVITAAESLANLVFVDDDDEGERWDVAQVLRQVDGIVPVLLSRAALCVAHDARPRVAHLLTACVERCLECLGNIAVYADDASTIAAGVVSLLDAHGTSAAPCILRGIARLLAVTLSSTTDIGMVRANAMASFATNSLDDGVRSAFVSALSRLATCNRQYSAPVGALLKDRLVNDKSARVFVESANGVMDVFADDGIHQQTIADLDLLATLRAVVNDASRWKCHPGSDYPGASDDLDEARDNLNQFIEYRLRCP
ncbi:unnamed protein product (mitochondrion) [Plasmodiophora brassicae]|uniref:SYO1-like TPR repeats domain-containing protein n=2 Tax=Plasmodiophora brassicae TaxID=37360 RepID=A0A3P3YK69_PLABS|nr:unnamed protein product [Plasmodiophora brassicae]